MRPDRSLMFWRQLAAMRAEPFAAVPDAELLARYNASRDEAAFEELARRHGGMVWAVCRQLLPDSADADDAFQAVFLAFIKSSGRIRHANVGAWLHGTAVRGAMKIRRGAVRARQRDRATAKPEAASPPGDWNELLAAVHDEVGRLPEALRTAFVVCDLEGVPQPDAAARLGWKAGTLTGRLSKARKRLLDALTKRGLAPAATLGLLGLSAATTSADVPLKLLVTVLNFPSAAPGTIPATLAALSLEIVPMTLSKVKLLAVAAMLTCGLAAGTGTVLVQVADAQAPSAGRPGGAPTGESPPPLAAPTAAPKPAAVAEVEYKYFPLDAKYGVLPPVEVVAAALRSTAPGWEFAGTFASKLSEQEYSRYLNLPVPGSISRTNDHTVMVFKKLLKQASVAVGGGEGGTAAGGSGPPGGGYPGASSASPTPGGFPGLGGPGGLTNVPLAATRVAAVPSVAPAFNADEDVLICTTSFVTAWNNNGVMQATQYAAGDVVKPMDVPTVMNLSVGSVIVVKRALLMKSLGQAAPPTAKLPTVVLPPKPAVESEPVVIELRSVSSNSAVALCQEVMPKSVKFMAIPRSNTIVVINATTDELKAIEKLLKLLDVMGLNKIESETLIPLSTITRGVVPTRPPLANDPDRIAPQPQVPTPGNTRLDPQTPSLPPFPVRP